MDSCKKIHLPVSEAKSKDNVKPVFTHGDAILLVDSDGKRINVNDLAALLNNSYIIPVWCKMGWGDHSFVGGCWSISAGLVAVTGGRICERCEECDADKFNKLHKVLSTG